VTADELGGSAWAHEEHGHLGGRPPAVDLPAERALAEVLVGAAGEGLLSAAHDVSVGGLAQTLVEMTVRHGTGAVVRLPAELDPFVALFSESTARAVVAVPSEHLSALVEICTRRRVQIHTLGTTVGSDLTFEGLFSVSAEELRATSQATLPTLFG
jgi:phosphoribosylformylglycinamidine synthase